MSHRPAILDLMRRRNGDVTTREVSRATGSPSIGAFREMAALESDGLVSRVPGVGSIANVGWRLAQAVEAIK